VSKFEILTCAPASGGEAHADGAMDAGVLAAQLDEFRLMLAGINDDVSNPPLSSATECPPAAASPTSRRTAPDEAELSAPSCLLSLLGWRTFVLTSERRSDTSHGATRLPCAFTHPVFLPATRHYYPTPTTGPSYPPSSVSPRLRLRFERRGHREPDARLPPSPSLNPALKHTPHLRPNSWTTPPRSSRSSKRMTTSSRRTS
jgi:hypothetical protein